MSTPSDFLEQQMKNAITTQGWTWWNIQPPSKEDIEDSQIPSLSVSEGPEDEHEDVCIHCQLNAVIEANENLAVELYEIKGNLEFLIKMLGGK